MSFKAMGWATSVKTGSPTKKLILLLLADRANNEGFCWPSMKTLVEDCEMSREAISRNIKQMAEANLLHVTKHANKDKWHNNIYHLHVTQDHIAHVTLDHTPCDSGSHGHVTHDHTNLSTEPLKESAVADAPSEEAVQFEKVASHYNKVRGAMPECIKLSEARRGLIRARIKEVGFDALLNIITECAAYPLFQGESKGGWIANLEWILKDSNFLKIREGNYADKKPVAKMIFRAF